MSMETQLVRSGVDFLNSFASTEISFRILQREWENNNLGNSVPRVLSDKNALIISESMGDDRLHELDRELREITESRVKDRSQKVFDKTGIALAYSSVAYTLIERVVSQPIFDNTLGNMFKRVGGSILVSLGLRDLSKPIIKDTQIDKHNRDIQAFLRSEGVI